MTPIENGYIFIAIAFRPFFLKGLFYMLNFRRYGAENILEIATKVYKMVRNLSKSDKTVEKFVYIM